ncbi:hypothetical protein EUGRSUZ_L02789 [Eucalyptus grandis]|uniref:Uncharacterized protein n=2 Tax=Eucalyptus TaxID=3932 RepID=A0AAD9WHM9_EUCGR|nr:hypothetical protein EUGRSUZ_L02789 [Eucalyptus grandis]
MKDQGRRDVDAEDALSSISAATDIVNSLGKVWGITIGDLQVPEDARREEGPETMSQIKLWKLNQLGVALFLRHNSKLLG